ncbi:MAG: enoyl-CoA hydratase-related protein [Candidatus Dormibacteria bacterium]
MSAALVSVVDQGAARRISLDSPGNRNALSEALIEQLLTAMERASGDPAVRVVVLSHSGSTFCSGADLKEQLQQRARSGSSSGAGPLVPVLKLLQELPKPVIAEVRGAVRGGGMGLVAASDIVIATGDASFAFSETRVGVAPAVVAVPVLARMQRGAALELFLTGRTFTSEDAQRAGLVNLVVRAGHAGAETERVVAELALGAPLAQAEIRRLVREVPRWDPDTAYTKMADLSRRLFSSPDGEEGMTAFRERRPPRWAG